MTIRLTRALAASIALGACAPASGPAGAPPAGTAADSIVLERTRCYGTCPAYRLSLTAAGAISFTSRNPDDEGRSASDRTTPEAFRRLVRDAEAIGFATLPDTLENHPVFCPMPSTDSPTAIVSIFAAGRVKSVADYRACAAQDGQAAARLAGLRALEARIDSTAGSSRWVRPASRR